MAITNRAKLMKHVTLTNHITLTNRIKMNKTKKRAITLANNVKRANNANRSTRVKINKTNKTNKTKQFVVIQYDNRKLYKRVSALTKINEQYCLLHGYKYLFVTKHYDLPPYWIKVKLMQELLQTNKYKGILWLDTDAVIHNFYMTLDDICKPNKSMYYCPDCPKWVGPFNAGVFLILNTHHGNRIVNDWLKLYDSTKWKNNDGAWTTDGKWAGIDYEQGSFIHFLIKKYKHYIHQHQWRLFQSFDIDDCEQLKHTIFTYHFVVAGGDKGKLIEPYLQWRLK